MSQVLASAFDAVTSIGCQSVVPLMSTESAMRGSIAISAPAVVRPMPAVLTRAETR